MKTDDTTHQNHRHAINNLISENPAERTKKELKTICAYGRGEGQNDAHSCQFRHARNPAEFIRQFHLRDY